MLFRQIFAQKQNREGKYLVNETYTCGCKKKAMRPLKKLFAFSFRATLGTLLTLP